jgi:hypothetical protein
VEVLQGKVIVGALVLDQVPALKDGGYALFYDYRGFPKTSVLGKLPWIYVEKTDFRPLFPKAWPKTVRF